MIIIKGKLCGYFLIFKTRISSYKVPMHLQKD